MYNADGTDSGHEWLEIHNTSNQSVDLTGWTFLENEVNHRLESDSLILPAGTYAVIADDSSTFSSQFGSVGLVIDSAFSLSNQGESIALVNVAEQVVDELTYAPGWGGDGDGTSLQRNGSDWITAYPTPGEQNATTPVEITDDEESGSGSSDDGSSPTFVMEGKERSSRSRSRGNGDSSHISIEAGEDRTVTAGVQTRFSGQIETDDLDWKRELKVRWNMGDGSVKKGEEVFYTYDYPGRYVAVMRVMHHDFSLKDSLTVTVHPARLSLTEVKPGADGYIKLTNNGGEVDLSRWHLRVAGDFFTIPPDTIVLPGASIIIQNQTSELAPRPSAPIALLYPDGAKAITYNPSDTSDESDHGQTEESSVSEPALPSGTSSSSDVSVTPATVVLGTSTSNTSNPATKSSPQSLTQQSEDSQRLATGTAKPLVASSRSAGFQWPWLLALLVVMASGGVAVYVLQDEARDDPIALGPVNEADEYDILD